MPVLHLHENAYAAVTQLAGIMLFPEESGKRHEIDNAFLMNRIKRLVPHTAEVEAVKIFNDQLDSYPIAHELIAEAFHKVQLKAGPIGVTFLLTLGTDSNFSSLNLSMSSIEKMDQYKYSTSVRSLENAWKAYRKVAHFWAAYQIWIAQGAINNFQTSPGFPCHPTELNFFLAMAERLRKMGEGFAPARARKGMRLLDKNRVWRVQSSHPLEKLPATDFVFGTMPCVMQDMLLGRKRYGL